MPDSAIPWTVARQAPLSMGFFKADYWSGLPCPAPGDLPNPGIEPTFLTSPALVAGSLPLSHLGAETDSSRWHDPHAQVSAVDVGPAKPLLSAGCHQVLCTVNVIRTSVTSKHLD